MAADVALPFQTALGFKFLGNPIAEGPQSPSRICRQGVSAEPREDFHQAFNKSQWVPALQLTARSKAILRSCWMLSCAWILQGGPVGEAPEMKKPAAGPPETVIRVLVPGRRAGKVIGKGGAIVKQLKDMTGARIRMIEGVPGCDERVCVLSCKEDSAAEMIPVQVRPCLYLEQPDVPRIPYNIPPPPPPNNLNVAISFCCRPPPPPSWLP